MNLFSLFLNSFCLISVSMKAWLQDQLIFIFVLYNISRELGEIISKLAPHHFCLDFLSPKFQTSTLKTFPSTCQNYAYSFWCFYLSNVDTVWSSCVLTKLTNIKKYWAPINCFCFPCASYFGSFCFCEQSKVTVRWGWLALPWKK